MFNILCCRMLCSSLKSCQAHLLSLCESVKHLDESKREKLIEKLITKSLKSNEKTRNNLSRSQTRKPRILYPNIHKFQSIFCSFRTSQFIVLGGTQTVYYHFYESKIWVMRWAMESFRIFGVEEEKFCSFRGDLS